MAKFTWTDVSLLIAGGCVSKVDVGWMEFGPDPQPGRQGRDA